MWLRAAVLGAFFDAVCAALGLSEHQFDLTEAQKFASVASSVYCDDTVQLSNWSCAACADSKTRLTPGKIKIVDGGYRGDTRVLIGKIQDDKGCVIAWRGTVNWVNMMEDIEFWEVSPSTFDDCEGCKVHRGFYHMWQLVSKEVFGALEEVGCGSDTADSQNLYVTGHSMGAAVVQLAMIDLDKAGYAIKKLYAFEPPRVGNQEFADAFQDRFKKAVVFRMSHNRDPVVHLPPWHLWYTHIAPEVFFDQHGHVTVCEKAENRTCADQFIDTPWMLVAYRGDHCATPLLPNGNMCNPEKCCSSKNCVKDTADLTLIV